MVTSCTCPCLSQRLFSLQWSPRPTLLYHASHSIHRRVHTHVCSRFACSLLLYHACHSIHRRVHTHVCSRFVCSLLLYHACHSIHRRVHTHVCSRFACSLLLYHACHSIHRRVHTHVCSRFVCFLLLYLHPLLSVPSAPVVIRPITIELSVCMHNMIIMCLHTCI